MKLLPVMICFLFLLACSGNKAVLKQDIEAQSRLIDTTLQTTHQFYDKLEQQRLNVLLEFIASRPACTIEPGLHILLDENRCLSKQELQLHARCRKNPKYHARCQYVSRALSFSLSPAQNKYRHTTIELLGLLAEYQLSLSHVLSDESYDSTLELKAIKAGMDALDKQARRMSAFSSAENKHEAGQSTSSINHLSTMIIDKRSQRYRFKDLKTLVTEKGPSIEKVLKQLLHSYTITDRVASDLYELQIIQQSRQQYNQMGVAKRRTLGRQQRKQMIEQYYSLNRQYYERNQQPDPVTVGLNGLIESHQLLLQGFQGELTASQRKRIAQANRLQLKRLFKIIFKIARNIH